MPNPIKDLREDFVDAENDLIFEKNVSIPIPGSDLPIRANVYRPRNSLNGTSPVLVTYGPYGKDVWYGHFHPKSYSEVDPAQKSKYAAWETPEPVFWTKHGCAVVRADERGTGQSPGVLDTMSRGTSEAFFHVVEWAAARPWSSGKVGLLGVSYYAGSQWRVAARRPKGLAAIIPWEGMSDYYRDRCRHGGILSNGFISFWWTRQVMTNQYGRPGRAATQWGDETLEGSLSAEELEANRRDQTADTAANRFLDDDYYASKEYDLGDIQVPVLSVANWGGNSLHLRGNLEGYTWAGSNQKWLHFVTGRHDLPFYYPEQVEKQRSFLDAFLKDDDWAGWKSGKIPKVQLTIRKGDKGVNDAAAEKGWTTRAEGEWPLARTEYTKFYLSSDLELSMTISKKEAVISYDALGTASAPRSIQFRTPPFKSGTEITGYIVAHLNLSMTPGESSGTGPFDIDLFATLRYIGPTGKEVNYTDAAGDPVPLCKGWLRLSLRKVNETHQRHRPYLPRRNYRSIDVLPVEPGQVYAVDIEIWPTNVVVERGGSIVLELASGDTAGSGLFLHNDPSDRFEAKFGGKNHLHFDSKTPNWLALPIILGSASQNGEH